MTDGPARGRVLRAGRQNGWPTCRLALALALALAPVAVAVAVAVAAL